MGRAPWETPNDPGPALEAGTRLWHHWLHQYAVWPQRRVFGVRIYQFYSVLLQPGEVSSDSGILILFNVDMFFFSCFPVVDQLCWDLWHLAIPFWSYDLLTSKFWLRGNIMWWTMYFWSCVSFLCHLFFMFCHCYRSLIYDIFNYIKLKCVYIQLCTYVSILYIYMNILSHLSIAFIYRILLLTFFYLCLCVYSNLRGESSLYNAKCWMCTLVSADLRS